MCSSGVGRALGGELRATPQPEALSFAPGTSSPRSSRSASIASEKASPPSAAAQRAAAREPAEQRAGGQQRAPKPRDLRAELRRCAHQPRDGTSGRSGSCPCARRGRRGRALRPRRARVATTLTLGWRESRSETGVKRRSPSSAAAPAPQREHAPVAEPRGRRCRARRRARRRTSAPYGLANRVAAELLELAPRPRAPAARRRARRRQPLGVGARAPGPMSSASMRITSSAAASCRRSGGAHRRGSCSRAPTCGRTLQRVHSGTKKRAALRAARE